MKNAIQILGIAVVFVTAIGAGLGGCGGDDEDQTGDGGSMGGTRYALKSGDYRVESASAVNDGCQIGVDKPFDPTTMMGTIGASFPLVMETTVLPDGGVVNTGKITLGNISGTPMEPSLGTGNISSNEGTLTSDHTIMAGSTCTFRRQTTSKLKLTDHYKFTLEVTRTHANPMMCTFTANCTSSWTWVMSCPSCLGSTGATGGSADAGRQ